jgi:NAD(P)-dependent dehydrogenase (short-subunit alcohol dehydrogenase family)
MNSLQHKTALVTGANSGIGLWTVIGMAQQGATVIMHARHRGRGEAALAEAKARSGATRIELVLADLSSPEQTRTLAKHIMRRHDRLDILVNNAAIVHPTRTLTPDGIETQFAVNHLSYFILTNELLPLLRMSAPARVINLTSNLHKNGLWNKDDPQGATFEYGFQGWGWYGVTKFYNVLFTYELARRLQGSGVVVNCVHPGIIGTNLTRALPKPLHNLYKMIMPKPEKGAATSLYLAGDPTIEGITGKYFVNKRIQKSAPATYDETAQAELWRYTESLIAPKDEPEPQFARV